MNTLDDRDDDDVGALLRSGYASDADPDFAASLLAEMQENLAPRPRHLWARWAAVAAGLAIVCGVAAILHSRHSESPVPVVENVPSDEVGPLVVRGRLVKWDAPIADFAVSEVIHGKLDAKTVQVDLTPELDALLNSAAGKDMVIELGQVSDGLRPKTKGRVLSWSGVTDLPPRDRWNNENDMVLTVVVNGSASAGPTIRNRWLTDEWGMPR
jgi:hypothetical protein